MHSLCQTPSYQLGPQKHPLINCWKKCTDCRPMQGEYQQLQNRADPYTKWKVKLFSVAIQNKITHNVSLAVKGTAQNLSKQTPETNVEI